MQLIIGNKNYSSWSMRPWVAMRAAGIAFDETRLRFDFTAGSAFRQAVARVSPAGLVPVLLDGDFAVWDTLAIVEYLDERHAGVWPQDARQRARARSLCAELHGGFGALRSHCPMNIEASLPDVGARVWAEQAEVRRDVARIDAVFGANDGPFLFGHFSAADAYYAPVCMRFLSYALPLSDAAQAYVARVAAHPAVAAWIADARAEADFLDFEEPYRTGR